jgi:hypothetical protein
MDESLAKASLLDGYRVAGFRVRARIKPHVRDPTGLVITLARRGGVATSVEIGLRRSPAV